jgi:hypothetical protein
MENLLVAHTHAEKALNVLYQLDGVKRPYRHRIALGKAQNTLITMYVRELNKKQGRNPKREHDWQFLDQAGRQARWGCSRCKLEGYASSMFWSGVLRHLPGRLGEKWRCVEEAPQKIDSPTIEDIHVLTLTQTAIDKGFKYWPHSKRSLSDVPTELDIVAVKQAKKGFDVE